LNHFRSGVGGRPGWKVAMSFKEILTKKQDAILNKWFYAILDTYPAETKRFLKAEKNKFANPVGSTTYEGIKGVYGELVQGMDSDRIAPFLDKIVRIRAVQEFTPSQAVGFVFSLKAVVREELKEEIGKDFVKAEDLLDWDARIDALALLSFNIYSQCREQMHEIRISEVKNRTHRLLQRANLIVEDPE
jgi:hypothetical protein